MAITYLYYAELTNGEETYYKIGISVNPVQRLDSVAKSLSFESITGKPRFTFKILFTEQFDNREAAREAESLVKRVFANSPKHDWINKTEIFAEDVLATYPNRKQDFDEDRRMGEANEPYPELEDEEAQNVVILFNKETGHMKKCRKIVKKCER